MEETDDELTMLAKVEEALWDEADGDVTRYLELIGEWIDSLVERGIWR